ncbi:MAG: hypothetical protein NVSMB27_03320 [Ktedonobacteraceae bacterium]
MAPGMDTPGQPELPAWLETLRSGEGPAPSTAAKAGETHFSPADFVDEGMLPSWMRPDRTDEKSPSDSYAGRRPASQPAPDTDGTFLPTRGMSAGSLIDEQFLPSWMQESQAASAQAGQQAKPENISASSLVQPGVLPEWIRTMQPQSPAPAPLDLMQNAQQANSSQPISGNDLIDQQALPQWMTGQNTQSSTTGQGEQASLAASSLVDVHALPPWLREANQEQRRESAAAFSPVQPWPAPGYQQPVGQVPQYQQPDWQMPASNYQVPNGQMPTPNYQQPDGQTPNMNSNLVAASLIDMNALPDWLRPAEGQQANSAQQRAAENLRQASFGVPARPENVRVPSRPRGEMGYHEESEVAASAFASMLGVASAAPYFQGQQPRDAYGRAQGPSQAQQPQAFFNAPAMGPLAGQGTPGMPPAAYGAQNQAYAPTPAAYQGGYAMGTMPGTSPQPPSSTPGMPSAPSSMSNGQSKPNAKPARRGIFDALRDFFFRS